MASKKCKRPLEDDADSDSDWEYEYHPTETETYYVTLDLSSAPSPPQKKQRVDATPTSTPAETTSETPPASAEADSSEADADRFQILDLHTRNPIVSYKGNLFSCSWGTTLGTDMIFSAPGATEGIEPLIRTPGFDLVTTTNIKLVGNLARLVPKLRAASEADPLPRSATIPPAPATLPHQPPPSEDFDPSIPSGALTNPSRIAQSRFLTRLIAAKQKRGDVDTVPVRARKTASGAGGAPVRAFQREEWQQGDEEIDVDASLNAEEEEDREAEDPAFTWLDPGSLSHSGERGHAGNRGGRPRGSQSGRGAWRWSATGSTSQRGGRNGGPVGSRGKTWTRQKTPGGLFRDFIPVVDDLEGADIRGRPVDAGAPSRRLGDRANETGNSDGRRVEEGPVTDAELLGDGDVDAEGGVGGEVEMDIEEQG